MATFKSLEVLKKQRNRGKARGVTTSASGTFRCGVGTANGASFALADTIQMLTLGEGQRPTKVTVQVVPVSGTPALTNPTFDVGVIDAHGGSYTRPDGTVYPAVATGTAALSPALAIPADNMAADTQVARPVATAAYGPYHVTLKPAGAGAFSVAGGVIDLVLTLEFNGEVKGDATVYNVYNATKVS